METGIWGVCLMGTVRVRVDLTISMVSPIKKGSGIRISKKDMVWSSEVTGVRSMGITKKELKMGKAKCYGKTNQNMKDNGLITKCMAMEHSLGQTANPTLVVGKKV
jgi:hypothetical protein